jgi:hypothetical protein
MMGARINVGCGDRPTPGWRNFDSSLSVRLARVPLLPPVLHRLGLIDDNQRDFARVVRAHRIEFGDATRRLPLAASSVEVLYSCHMLEHLDRQAAGRFLREAGRVLAPFGILRIIVPDLRKLIEAYLQSGDADAFIEASYLGVGGGGSPGERLRLAVHGARHRWMYDGPSLCRLLAGHGFVEPQVAAAGATTIPDPHPLDLFERAAESVCVEAQNPQREAGR